MFLLLLSVLFGSATPPSWPDGLAALRGLSLDPIGYIEWWIQQDDRRAELKKEVTDSKAFVFGLDEPTARGHMMNILPLLDQLKTESPENHPLAVLNAIVLGQHVCQFPASNPYDWHAFAMILFHLDEAHKNYRDLTMYLLLKCATEKGFAPAAFNYAQHLLALAATTTESWFAAQSPDPIAEAWDVLNSIHPDAHPAIPGFSETLACHTFFLNSFRGQLWTAAHDSQRHGKIISAFCGFPRQFLPTEQETCSLWFAPAERLKDEVPALRQETRGKLAPETDPLERLVYHCVLLSCYKPEDPESKRDLCFAADTLGAVPFKNPQVKILALWLQTFLYKVSADRTDGGPAACAKYANQLLHCYTQFSHMWESRATWFETAKNYANQSIKRVLKQFEETSHAVRGNNEDMAAFFSRVLAQVPQEAQKKMRHEIGWFHYILVKILTESPTCTQEEQQKIEKLIEISKTFGDWALPLKYYYAQYLLSHNQTELGTAQMAEFVDIDPTTILAPQIRAEVAACQQEARQRALAH